MEPKEILLLDEKAPIVSAIGYILQSRGYLVLLAPDVETAAEELENYHFDLIIAYLTGDGRDKLDLLRRVKQRSPQSKVMVAANPKKATLPIEAFQVELDDYLLAPFSAPELCRRVEQCLARNTDEAGWSKTEEINGRMFDSLRLTFRDLHNCLISMLSGLRVLKDSMVDETDLSKFAMLNGVSRDVSNCICLSEEFLYKTFLCDNEIDNNEIELKTARIGH